MSPCKYLLEGLWGHAGWPGWLNNLNRIFCVSRDSLFFRSLITAGRGKQLLHQSLTQHIPSLKKTIVEEYVGVFVCACLCSFTATYCSCFNKTATLDIKLKKITHKKKKASGRQSTAQIPSIACKYMCAAYMEVLCISQGLAQGAGQ